MKAYHIAICGLAALLSLALVSVSHAVSITGGTAPGGFVLANGTSNLKLWLKADAITSVPDNTTFSNWTESSNTAGVVTGSLGSNPTYRANTLGLNTAAGYTSSVEFIGGNVLSLAGLTNLTTGSAFGVASPQNDRYLLQHTANRQLRLRQNNVQNIAAYNGADNPLSTAFTTSAGNYMIAEWLGDASSISFFENGAARGTGTLATSPTGLSNVGYDRIGLPGSSTATANFSEIVVFNTLLNSAERQIVENALSAKWNLPMLANDRYSGDSLAGNYDRDVIGIGRVDASNLVTSAGNAGFGIEATGSLDNGDFVLAGHNVASNGTTTAGVQPGGMRWTRNWYVEETGNVDVTLAFDWSDAGLGAPNLLFDHLLFSNDGITFTDTSLIGLYTGDRILFNLSGSQLTTGFYTLGQTPPAPEPASILLLGTGLVGMSMVRRRKRASSRKS